MRQQPVTPFDYFERGWRPLLAYSCGFIVAAFVVAMLGAVAYGTWKAILTGTSLPNLSAGLENFFSQALPYMAAIVGTLWGLMQQRSHEVRTEISVNGPRPPFPSSVALPAPTDSPTGGLQNNEALR
jgi:hypothetical protein